MPLSPTFRNREITRETCLRDFAGRDSIRSAFFDASSLPETYKEEGGRYRLPIGLFLTKSTSDPTKVKIFENKGTNANAVQTLTETGEELAGTFTLEYGGQVTGAIKAKSTAEEIATALIKLSTIGTSENIKVTGEETLDKKAQKIEFIGELGNLPQPLIVVNYSGLTSKESKGKIVVTTTTPGTTAEKIIGVFNGPDKDFWGNTVSKDEPIPVYFHACTFDITKLPQWTQYGLLAEKALANCNFF